VKGSAIESRACRAARAFLNWSARRLATRSGVSVQTILDLERDRGAPNGDLLRLERAFREAGLQFLTQGERGVGVCLAPGQTQDVGPKMINAADWLPYGAGGPTRDDKLV